MTINPDRIYSTREAADLCVAPGAFAIPRERITLDCAEGTLPASKVGGRYLIRGYELRRYMIAMGLEVDDG